MAPAIRSSIEAALWLHRAAQADRKNLSAQKLQRLLYLAQTHFAGINGRAMMPATFLAGELGPYEPNVYVVFEAGPPEVTAFPMEAKAEAVLTEIWRLHGGKSADALAKMIGEDGAYVSARTQGVGTEIQLPAMMAAFHGMRENGLKQTARARPSKQADTGNGGNGQVTNQIGKLSSETILNVVGEEKIKPALILRSSAKRGGKAEGKRCIDEIAESLALTPKVPDQSARRSGDGLKEVVKWRPKRNITRH